MKSVGERDDAREWLGNAIGKVQADANRSSDTHLHVFSLPSAWGIQLYLKDESVHPTGSLKHRLARSMFLYSLCNGWINEGTTIVEASSGSTAVSEAYFAKLLGLPFIAVMPRSTSVEKIALIEKEGGAATSSIMQTLSMRRQRGWRKSLAVTTWTSSPTRNERPTGEATTTSPNPSSIRCRWSQIRSPAGWLWVQVLVGRAPRSVASSATAVTQRNCS